MVDPQASKTLVGGTPRRVERVHLDGAQTEMVTGRDGSRFGVHNIPGMSRVYDNRTTVLSPLKRIARHEGDEGYDSRQDRQMIASAITGPASLRITRTEQVDGKVSFAYNLFDPREQDQPEGLLFSVVKIPGNERSMDFDPSNEICANVKTQTDGILVAALTSSANPLRIVTPTCTWMLTDKVSQSKTQEGTTSRMTTPIGELVSLTNGNGHNRQRKAKDHNDSSGYGQRPEEVSDEAAAIAESIETCAEPVGTSS